MTTVGLKIDLYRYMYKQHEISIITMLHTCILALQAISQLIFSSSENVSMLLSNLERRVVMQSYTFHQTTRSPKGQRSQAGVNELSEPMSSFDLIVCFQPNIGGRCLLGS